MGACGVGDWNVGAVASREVCGRTLHLRGQRSRVWVMSLLCSAEAFLAGILPVAVTAPPPVRSDRHRITVPRSFTRPRVRRKTARWGGDDGEENYDEWGFDGSGGYGGMGGGGGGGWSYGRGHHSWDGDGDMPEFFVYQVACWISLSHCLHFALKKLPPLINNGLKNSSPEAAANC